MSNFDEIFERIKFSTNTRTQVELAEVLDIRQSSISDAKRRNSVPAEWFMKLFERFGLNPDWLKKGSGPMYLRTEMGYKPVESSMPLSTFEDVALYSDPDAKSDVLSVFSMQNWPGEDPNLGSSSATAPKVAGKLSVPTSFSTPGVKVFLLDGTNMEPLIRKGAFIGIDTTQKQLVSGELYGVMLPYQGLAIKRLFVDATGEKLILRTENPQHPEVTLAANAADKAVLGRVAWMIQRF